MRLTTMTNSRLGKEHRGEKRNGMAFALFLFFGAAVGVSCIAIFFSMQITDAVPYPDMMGFDKPQQMKRGPDTDNTVEIELELDRAIFYNIFIPQPPDDNDNDNERGDYALSVVEEQLGHYSSTTAGTRSSVTVNYMLIGNTGAAGDLQRICEKHNIGACQLLQAVEQGDEVLTLEALYDYCQEHPLSLVTYLHNKGSFHPSPENTAIRKLLTKSVFSDECQDMPIDECSVCALRFSPLPFTHFTGNMWTAHCSYIQKLIRPSHFSSKMHEMVDYSFAVNNETVFPKPHKRAQKKSRFGLFYGLGRHSSEYWVGSHPTLKPCDVFPDPEYLVAWHYRNGTVITNQTNTDGWEPVRQKVPWMPLQPEVFLQLQLPLDRFWTEWFCGYGRLAQYKFLYGAYPDADSFIWKYYEKEYERCLKPIKKSEYLLL